MTSNRSGEMTLRLGQEEGKVEPGRAIFLRGCKVCSRPVALDGGQFGVFRAGFRPVAVVLVVSQVASQVAQSGLGPARDTTSTVAIRAEGGSSGERRGAELLQLGDLERREPPGGVQVLANLIGIVHRGADRGDPFVGPDRLEQALELRQMFLLQDRRHPGNRFLERSRQSLGAAELAGRLLHRDQVNPRLLGHVEGLDQRRFLVQNGLYWTMMTSVKPPRAAARMYSARLTW